MPSGNYSQQSDSTGASWQHTFAISEPGSDWAQNSARAVSAKEPDRQTATRRGSQSSRSRSGMEESAEQESQPRSRTAQRASSTRRSAQARRGAERGQSARRTAEPAARTSRTKKSRRGFAAMSPEQQREIARKGGLTVSRNRRHMADIGRVGGEHSHGGRRGKR
jgi:general stress protein YciG